MFAYEFKRTSTCGHCGFRIEKRPLESWRHIEGPSNNQWFYCADGHTLVEPAELKASTEKARW